MLGLLSAGISGVGAIAGGVLGSSAAKKAAQAQVAAGNRASTALQQGNTQAAQVLAPYSNEGAGARSLYNAALGVPTGQGGASAVANDDDAYRAILQQLPAIAAQAQREVTSRKSPMYGASVLDYVRKWVSDSPDGKQMLDWGRGLVAQNSPAQAAGPTAADAEAAFQGTRFAQNANEGTRLANDYSNELWKPLGGVDATFDQSPWAGITERATTKANELFTGLAGGAGSLLSGRTAKGLQENTANINDMFHGQYLDAYNNAATQGLNAKTSALGGQNDAFANWMNGLNGVAQTGLGVDRTIAGNAVNAGATQANIQTGNGQAQANGIMNASNATQNALGGVFNAIGQGVQALAPNATPQQQPKTNALYMGGTHSNGAPVRLRQQLAQPRFA